MFCGLPCWDGVCRRKMTVTCTYVGQIEHISICKSVTLYARSQGIWNERKGWPLGKARALEEKKETEKKTFVSKLCKSKATHARDTEARTRQQKKPCPRKDGNRGIWLTCLHSRLVAPQFRPSDDSFGRFQLMCNLSHATVCERVCAKRTIVTSQMNRVIWIGWKQGCTPVSRIRL